MTAAPDITIKQNKPKLFITHFSVSKMLYVFQVEHLRGWTINFFPYGKQIKLDMKETIQLFSAVAESLNLFIGAKNPKTFHFMPGGMKLVNIYDRFAKKIAKKLPQYKYTKVGSAHYFDKK